MGDELMRTTLTIDDDIAARLRQLASKQRFKETVNRALRLGLHAMENPGPEQPACTTPVPGQPRTQNIGNIAEVLASVERDDWK